MNFNIFDRITTSNSKNAIKYLFGCNNIAHQSIIIYQLSQSLNNIEILNNLRNFIFENSNKITSDGNCLDTCGTGGDGLKTLNISTTVAFLLASVGIPIAKHGNRAASSASGSTDIINELKIICSNNAKINLQQLKKNNFTYLNAPLFYPNLGLVAEVRKLIGKKNIFNFMGPTLNPMNAKYQLLGTTDEFSCGVIANILMKIKLKDFNVFYSKDGLDEISIFAPTVFYSKKNNRLIKKEVHPNSFYKFLCHKPNFKQIIGKDPKYNTTRLLELFNGKKDSYRDMVVINAIYGMLTYNKKLKFEECYETLTNALDKGIAYSHLIKLQLK